jgi:hypothetical protein
MTSEVNAWKSAGGRSFDVIVVGGGTFGSAIAPGFLARFSH